VRAHLSRIFEKTGVRRQAELVRLLMQGDMS
jgi:DNA-binding CsgD family transcriptional regulator